MKPKLNGWKRIGIIASFVWVLGAGYYTFDRVSSSDSELIGEVHAACDARQGGTDAGYAACDREAEATGAAMLSGERLEAVVVALVPVRKQVRRSYEPTNAQYCLSHLNTWLAFTPFDRATRATDRPAANVCSTICHFSFTDHRRCVGSR